MDYAQFSSADFICDEYFQNWIITPDKQTDDFWNEWLLQHPEKRETVEEAKRILLGITFKEDFPTDDEAQTSLASTLSRINAIEHGNESKRSSLISVVLWKRMIRIAAVFIIVALTASVILYNYW